MSLLAGGELGALVRTHDWASTPLGPIVMLWGEDGIMIYNDAYSVFAGGRHPRLLGSKVREGWPEVAEFNDHVMKVGLAGGTLACRDRELTLYRRGEPEQVWMNLDYSPVLDESGRPVGYADLTALRKIGEDRVVQKPFRNDDLAGKIRRLLGTSAEASSKVVPLRR